MSKFNATHIPFKDGLERIDQAFGQAGVERSGRIITSRDKDVIRVCNLLAVNKAELPKGFIKWQLPFSVREGQFFVTTAQPGARVGEHSHEDDGVRFIMQGSIFYDGIELSAGDWMYIPKGQPYSFETGPLGASMCYCYACCCAGRILNSGDDVINPGQYARIRESLR